MVDKLTGLSKEWLEVYFEHGIDPIRRRIWLSDDVEEQSIANVQKGLYLLDDDDSEKPIELFVSSYGGSIYEMFALYDVIRTIEAPVHTVAIGKCMSAAPLLVAAGTQGERWAAPHAWFMFHDISTESDGKVTSVGADYHHTVELSKMWYELLSRHSKKPVTYWEDICGKSGDHYISAPEAVRLGVIDQLWAPTKKIPRLSSDRKPKE